MIVFHRVRFKSERRRRTLSSFAGKSEPLRSSVSMLNFFDILANCVVLETVRRFLFSSLQNVQNCQANLSQLETLKTKSLLFNNLCVICMYTYVVFIYLHRKSQSGSKQTISEKTEKSGKWEIFQYLSLPVSVV